MPSSLDPFPITTVFTGLSSRFVEQSDLESGALIMEANPNTPSTAAGSVLELADGVEFGGIVLLESGDDYTGNIEARNPMVFVKARLGTSAVLLHQHEQEGLLAKHKLFVAGTETDLVIGDDQIVQIIYDREIGCWVVYPMRDPKPVGERILAGPSALALNSAVHATYYGPTVRIAEMAVNTNTSIPALNSATVQLVINGNDVVDGAVAVAAGSAAGTKTVAAPTDAVLADGDRIGARVSTAAGLLLGGLSVTTCLRLVES